MNKIIASIDEEFQAMLSGRFIPYHIAAFMMAIMITLIVSVCARHGEVFEGKIAVIDLDSSHLSTTLIEKLNTSAYLRSLRFTIHQYQCEILQLMIKISVYSISQKA